MEDEWTRIYTNLPSHSIIYLSFDLYRIDAWTEYDVVRVNINGTYFDLTGMYATAVVDICGALNPDLQVIRIYIKCLHSDSNLEIGFISGINVYSNPISFGVRNIDIHIRQKTTIEVDTVYSQGEAPPFQALQFTCGAGFYYEAGCRACDPSCATCALGGANNCLECNTGYYFDGTQCSQCDLTCKTCVSSSSANCTSCYVTNYLSYSRTCIQECGANPIQVGNQLYCQPFCPVFGYVLPGGQCESSCPFPYSPFYGNGEYLCEEYVCAYPRLRLNGQCECPGSTTAQSGACLISGGIYLLSIIVKVVIIAGFSASILGLMLGSDGTIMMSFLILVQQIYYTTLYNVNGSVTARQFSQVFSIGRFNFFPNPYYWITDLIPNTEAPDTFQAEGYTGLFIQNCGGVTFIAFVGGCMYLLVLFILVVLGTQSKVVEWARRARRFYRWSGLWRIILTLYTEYIIAGLLELKWISFHGYPNSISSVFAIFSILLGFYSPFEMLRVLRREMWNTNQIVRKYDALIEDYDINVDLKRFTTIIITVRRLVVAFSVVVFYHAPLLQVFIPLGGNVLVIIWIYSLKPHSRDLLNWADIFVEGFHMAVNLFMLIIAFNDLTDSLDVLGVEIIGLWIVSCATIATFVYSIVLFYEQVMAIKDVIMDMNKQRLTNPVLLLKNLRKRDPRLGPYKPVERKRSSSKNGQKSNRSKQGNNKSQNNNLNETDDFTKHDSSVLKTLGDQDETLLGNQNITEEKLIKTGTNENENIGNSVLPVEGQHSDDSEEEIEYYEDGVLKKKKIKRGPPKDLHVIEYYSSKDVLAKGLANLLRKRAERVNEAKQST